MSLPGDCKSQSLLWLFGNVLLRGLGKFIIIARYFDESTCLCVCLFWRTKFKIGFVIIYYSDTSYDVSYLS